MYIFRGLIIRLEEMAAQIVVETELPEEKSFRKGQIAGIKMALSLIKEFAGTED